MPTLNVNGKARNQPPLFSAGNALPFILVTALFLFWGIPSNLNDILIKQFMKSFEITRFKAGLIQFAFYMGYFLLSMPAAFLMRKYGYKMGLVTGLFLFSAGTFLFWPAARVQEYSFFLVALFVIARGQAFLELRTLDLARGVARKRLGRDEQKSFGLFVPAELSPAAHPKLVFGQCRVAPRHERDRDLSPLRVGAPYHGRLGNSRAGAGGW